MTKGGGLDPGGRADPISPNLLIGFAARCSLHNLPYVNNSNVVTKIV